MFHSLTQTKSPSLTKSVEISSHLNPIKTKKVRKAQTKTSKISLAEVGDVGWAALVQTYFSTRYTIT